MLRFVSVALMMTGVAHSGWTQSVATPSLGTRLSVEALQAQAENLLSKKAEEVRKLEFIVAESEARNGKASKELAEYDRYLEDQLEGLQFVRERLNQSQDDSVVLVGNRRYPQAVVEENVTARCEEIAETAQSRDAKAEEVEAWSESIQRQKTSLNRVKAQLSKAKAISDEQQRRWERAAQELAVSDLVQQTCSRGDLLFASNTELGDILGALELELGTLEALLDMRKSKIEVDLSDIREAKQDKGKGAKQ